MRLCSGLERRRNHESSGAVVRSDVLAASNTATTAAGEGTKGSN